MAKASQSAHGAINLSRVSHFLAQILWPFRWQLLLQVSILSCWGIYVSLTSYLLKQMIDTARMVERSGLLSAMMPYAVSYFACVVGIIALYRIYGWLHFRSIPRIEQRVTCTLSEQLLHHSYQFYQEQMAGSLANNVRLISLNVAKIVELVSDKIIRPVVTVMIAVWTVSQVSILFGILWFGWFAIFIMSSVWAGSRIRVFAGKVATGHVAVVGQLVDMIGNMLSVRLFGGSPHEFERVCGMAGSVAALDEKRLRFFNMFFLFQGILNIIFLGSNVALLVWGLINGIMSPGDFALVLMIGESITSLLWRMSQEIASLSDMIGVIGQGLRVIMEPIQVQDILHAPALRVTKGEIAYNKVVFQYTPGHNFFNGLSITIHSGQRVGLVGYSGSGKSTFVNLLLRLFDIQGGTILIDGQPINQVSQSSLRHQISFIPQDPTLFHRTIYENIIYARPNATPDEVIAAARSAHADEFIRKCPKGYQTVVGERGIKLSGGQRQRIAIARAFLKDGPILMLDEATSQLDSATEAHIQESLWELMNGKTVLVIAHRLSTLLHMDRILVFDNGAIIQDRSHQQLVSKPGLYKTLWDHQIGGFLPDQSDDVQQKVD